ncbi:MAG: TonB-dependent receptor domain-containing protein [Flavisolibacter sp.]
MRRIFTLIGFVLLTCSAALSQSLSKISGLIKDEQSKALTGATISLLRAKDSALVKIAISDKTGLYEFLNIKDGNYLISFSSVGYTKKFSTPFELKASDIEMPTMALSQSAGGLNNVTVTAKKPFIESQLDKTVVNVDASPTSAGASAMDILEKSPGVMVNNDGVISLRGKQGVIIMVDGKLTYLSAADLANMLKNMPSSALDQIEIITNPSAKYDASGNSGIINIKTKKGKNDGFNGSFMVGATTSIYKMYGNVYMMPKSQNSFNFNYRKKDFNFFGNYNPNFFRGRNALSLQSNYYDESTGAFTGSSVQETRFKFGNFNQTLKLGLDWYANKKNVFGIVVGGFAFNGHPTPQTESIFKDANGQVNSRMISNTENDISFKNFTGNLNWKHSYDSTGKELTADFDYVVYRNTSDMELKTVPYSGTGVEGPHALLRGHLPSHIDIYSFKSDYTKPFKNGRLEAGVKISYVSNDNVVDYKKFESSKWVEDDRSSHFIYKENINAAYVNANRQFKKWTVQAGLRLENTLAKGDQVGENASFDWKNTSLFPSAFASYELNKTNKLNLSYSRRITRPNYQSLNPFIYFLDSLTYMQGNPKLKPQFTHNIELSHAFKGKFITTLGYNNTNDVIAQIVNREGLKSFLKSDNVAKFRNLSLSITAPFSLSKWWNVNFFTTIYNNHYTGTYKGTPIDVQATSFMGNLTNTFIVTKTFTAELSGFYRHKGVDQLTVMQPIYQMSIGLQKQIIKGKGTLRFNIRDPFAWQKFEGHTKYAFIDGGFLARPDIRQVTGSFTLRFGKQTQQQQRRRSNSSQDEQSRVGGAGQG